MNDTPKPDTNSTTHEASISSDLLARLRGYLEEAEGHLNTFEHYIDDDGRRILADNAMNRFKETLTDSISLANAKADSPNERK
tara:strand:+ start:69 stop:317 length:249 start_codon:yes stop_codon:yes gene_type:complete